MNGDIGKVYKVVSGIERTLGIVEERQKNQHQENKNNIKDLKSSVEIDISRLHKMIWGIVFAIILTAINSFAG